VEGRGRVIFYPKEGMKSQKQLEFEKFVVKFFQFLDTLRVSISKGNSKRNSPIFTILPLKQPVEQQSVYFFSWSRKKKTSCLKVSFFFF
jgi:hypothetical protein